MAKNEFTTSTPVPTGKASPLPDNLTVPKQDFTNPPFPKEFEYPLEHRPKPPKTVVDQD